MDSTWIIGILIVLGIAIAAILLLAQKRRSNQLRKHFGPEYDHALGGFGERRAAERALAERTRRVDKLQIHPLAPERRDALWAQWQQVQARFVDDPAAVLDEAHRLLSTVLREQGYPTGRFEEEVELVSVHHPATVQHYRAAHELAEQRARGRQATEELRQAMIHYRALFEDLMNLGVPRELHAPNSHAPEVRREV